MLLEIEERRIEPDILVVALAGRLEMGRESQQIEALMESLARGGPRKAVLDMSRVGYIDSTGIGMIALASGRMKENAGQLVVVAPGGRVRQMLKLTQVDKIVTVCPSLAEAEQVFGAAQAPAAD